MSTKLPVYLDYAATTPVDPAVAAKMTECLTLEGNFANPASRTYRYGWMAEEAVDIARGQVAELINCDPREIVFTSGATESDNLAIKGVALRYADKGKHIVTVNTEHKAVLDTCAYLEEQGFEVSYLPVDEEGLVSVQQVKQSLREDTILVSIMHVNNEIGVIQDIAAIGQLCRDNNVLFHVDAAQSLGKLSIDLSLLPVDLMSFSGHKIYGPKGIGALYVRRRPKVELVAQIHGGGHERGMRSGTLATHQIVGLGEACHIAGLIMKSETKRLYALREKLAEGLSHIGGVILNGHPEKRIYNNLNVCFADVEGEMLTRALGNDIAVSSGSACNSANLAPSYVLSAIGRDEALALSGIRFTVGRFTSEQEVEHTISRVADVVARLRHTPA
ncbi:IscS subfamily cysteine desulfurase [Alteromonas ponticola]|uniref:cysteine desulfurase n=1 Tax=Alteromonas aquimaris TaxID=2998417 RepID=A0ABT3P5E7_9ALTE|nr:IscS subfamily cysteine desulfurase [Alteromonas aquimaris]MCW8107311.1 IscS subfamily cysteine desulfurase [Alteromonas aquimaris]